MKRLIALAVATIAIGASPAMADDAAPFSGAHAGIEGGWSRLGGGNRIGSDGFVYGATLGYDIASGPLRFGPEVGISDATQKACTGVPASGPTAQLCQRSDRDLYAGGRVGYVASPAVLIYGKAGYTNTRFSDRLTTASDYTETARDRSGYRLGAGVEYAVAPRIYLTGEYRYSHWSQRIHQNQILSGVGFRF